MTRLETYFFAVTYSSDANQQILTRLVLPVTAS